MKSIMILIDSLYSIGSSENSWVVSLRMSLVEEDEVDPLDDFFLGTGFDDFDAIVEDLEAIAEVEKSLKNILRKEASKEDDSQSEK